MTEILPRNTAITGRSPYWIKLGLLLLSKLELLLSGHSPFAMERSTSVLRSMGSFGYDLKAEMRVWCHGTPRPLRPHAPDHLRPSPTPSAYTPVSLRYTLHKLAQPRHSCHQTKLGSMSNFPGLCPYVSGCHLFVFFSFV